MSKKELFEFNFEGFIDYLTKIEKDYYDYTDIDVKNYIELINIFS
jgi:hypothetical protein